MGKRHCSDKASLGTIHALFPKEGRGAGACALFELSDGSPVLTFINEPSAETVAPLMCVASFLALLLRHASESPRVVAACLCLAALRALASVL